MIHAHVHSTFQGRNVFGLHKERKSQGSVTKRFSQQKTYRKLPDEQNQLSGVSSSICPCLVTKRVTTVQRNPHFILNSALMQETSHLFPFTHRFKPALPIPLIQLSSNWLPLANKRFERQVGGGVVFIALSLR